MLYPSMTVACLLLTVAVTPSKLAGQVLEKQSLNVQSAEDGFVHFELELNADDKSEVLYKALHVFERLENYRFVNERRRIRLSDGLGFVVLYSAQELMNSSGRRIRPQNIQDPSRAPEVQFVFTDQGTIKEIVTTR